MNTPEQPFKPLPIRDDVVVKRTDSYGEPSYQSSKKFVNDEVEPIRDSYYSNELCEQGIKAEILEPGKHWVTGIIRLRLVVEFIPDEAENNGTSDKFVSSLDDIRNINL